MQYESVELHNVAATKLVGDGGVRLQRVPEDVREELNEGARERMLRPAGAEIRFVSDSLSVEVTLSCPNGSGTIHPYWGPFRGSEPISIEGGPQTFELRYPEAVDALDTDVGADFEYDPSVWRLVLSGDPILFHGVDGEKVRPPESGSLPNQRYIAYGTSITEGAAATGPHLTYLWQTARRIGADPLNLGSGGSAYCEPAIADYIARRDDWDLVTLALSVNMFGAGFTVETFRERVTYMLQTIAETGRPVACITLFPFAHDLSSSERYSDAQSEPEAYRCALREVVEGISRSNVCLLEGPELLSDAGGLSPDLVHPSDHGMVEIAERLSSELDAHV
jgi:lysophospholipase L1-like esterase